MTDGTGDLSFTGRRCPAQFQLRTLTLQPADAIDFRPADWADAVVVVERGELQIECRTGQRATFPQGAVLVFDGIPLRRLGNAGRSPLVLSALSRSGVVDEVVRPDR